MSLDGPEDMHNAFRRFAGDGNSWSAVMGCVELLKKHDVAFSVLCVVNSLTGMTGRNSTAGSSAMVSEISSSFPASKRTRTRAR